LKIAKFLTATALGGMASINPAFAQDTEQGDSEFDDDAIIVTASKRETTLQELPVSVSVTTAETIEQAAIRDLIDLQTVAPSLRVNQLQSSANTNFIIRGFGNGANNPGIEPSVGVFIDGVYRSRSAAQIGDLPNIQRVEVLRGPQSTLFGKNASAGVISIVTQKPQFEFGGNAEFSYGNFDAIVAKASVTGPISDSIAFSLAGSYNNRDGYARDLNLGIDVNERNRYGIRGQLLFEPNDALSVRIIGDYDNIDENCCVAANLVNGPTNQPVPGILPIGLIDALAGGPGLGLEAEAPFSFEVRNNFPSSNDIDNYGGSVQVDYELGAISLTSITAYREVRADTNQDSDFTAAELLNPNIGNTDINTFTQEVRVASDFDGPFNFLLGGYYFNEDINQFNQILFGDDIRGFGDGGILGATGGALDVAAVEAGLGASLGDPTLFAGQFFAPGQGLTENFGFSNEAFSIFGSIDFEITDRLTFSAGANFTSDKKSSSSNVVSTSEFAFLDLDDPAFAPFRNQLLLGGGLTAAGVDPNDPAAVFAFATNPLTAPIFAGIQAFANANENNPAANPLAGLTALQFLGPFLNFPNAVEDGRTSDTDLSYSARLSYEINDNLNVYAAYGTGFKASSINLSRDSRPFPADQVALEAAGLTVVNQTFTTRFAEPEEAEVFEVGLKGAWDNFAFNLTLFDQTLSNFQSNVFTGLGFVLTNAPESSVRGFEFDASVSPVEGLTFNFALTHLDAELDDFPNSSVGDLSGQTPAGIPAFNLSVGGTYVHEFNSGTTLTFHADYQHESNVQIADGLPGFIDNDLADPFAPAIAAAEPFRREVNLLNASATLALNNGIEVGVWGRNLTDSQFITTIFDVPAQAGSINGYPNQPRTYGGVVRFRF